MGLDSDLQCYRLMEYLYRTMPTQSPGDSGIAKHGMRLGDNVLHAHCTEALKPSTLQHIT